MGSTGRRTVAKGVALEGYGLFSALASRLVIAPATGPHGIVVQRTDLPDQPRISASVNHVVARPRQTVLTAHPETAGSPGVHTVEHVMSALAALGITDAVLELHGAEVPMGDGSSRPFAEAVLSAGIVPLGQGSTPEPLVVRRPIRVQDNGSWIEAQPADGPWMDAEYRLDYGPGAPVPSQSFSFRLRADEPDIKGYLREVAPARTFCTAQEAEAMRAAGMFSHLQPRDVLVIGPQGPIDTAYRLEREPARHKVLDLIGDLALAGRPVHGRITAFKSGHALNHAMARQLLVQAV